MKIPTAWKKAATVVCLAAMTGCTAMSPILLPSDSDNKITKACVWENDPYSISYVTAKGDIYQVDAGHQYARVAGDIESKGVVVFAHYNALPHVIYGPIGSPNHVMGLTVDAVIPKDASVAPPSQSDLLGSGYSFRDAAQMAQHALYHDRSQMPVSFCDPAMRVERNIHRHLRVMGNNVVPTPY